jgi:hypothetical protein
MEEAGMVKEAGTRGEPGMSPTEALRVRGASEHDGHGKCENENPQRGCDDRPP